MRAAQRRLLVMVPPALPKFLQSHGQQHSLRAPRSSTEAFNHDHRIPGWFGLK